MLEELYQKVVEKDPAQPEFHQAVQEVLESLEVVLEKHPEYRKARIPERIVEYVYEILHLQKCCGHRKFKG